MINSLFRLPVELKLVLTLVVSMQFQHAVDAVEKQTLIMGWEEWAPFTFKDQADQITGLDADLVKTIITGMGHDVQYRELPWKRTLHLIEKGQVHIGASAFKTEERAAYAHFSIPYQNETYIMYVRKGEATKYPQRSLKDIKNSTFRFGTLRGSVYGHTFNELMKDPKFSSKVEPVAKDEQNHLKLLSGRFDGFIQETSRLLATEKNADILSKIEPLFVVDQDALHIMFSKKSVSAEFVHQFNQQLQTFMNSGSYEKLFTKYGLNKSNMITENATKSAAD